MALFAKETEKTLASVKLQGAELSAVNQSPRADDDSDRNVPKIDRVVNDFGRRAYLDAGSKLTGKLRFEKSVQIDGQVDGEIDARAELVIGPTAIVTAHITAASIVVSGSVNGELTATDRIEIQPSAKVTGKIKAPKLLMQEGAVFEGNCTMQPKELHQNETALASGRVRNNGSEKPEESRLLTIQDGPHAFAKEA